MPEEQTEPNLRHIVGILSVGKAQLRAGILPTEPYKWHIDDYPALLTLGTPARPPAPQEFYRRRRSPRNQCRAFEVAKIYPQSSVREAVSQLSKVMESHATWRDITLILAIATRVDEEEILGSFSSAVVGVVCLEMAAIALDAAPFLTPAAMKKLDIPKKSLRVAYNQLWLSRKQLENTIRRRGGTPALLPHPLTANGELEEETSVKDVGLPVPVHDVCQLSRENFCRRTSPLKQVVCSSECALDDDLDSGEELNMEYGLIDIWTFWEDADPLGEVF